MNIKNQWEREREWAGIQGEEERLNRSMGGEKRRGINKGRDRGHIRNNKNYLRELTINCKYIQKQKNMQRN